jgi:adenine-specific DNA-methyltransferase
MPIKYIPYQAEPLRGQAVLPFLRYKRVEERKGFVARGMPLFEVELIEKVGKKKSKNKVIHGDCLNACAYLKDQGTKVDLVYIDPPFASGANYAKKIYVRNNPKLVAKLEQAGKEMDNKDLQSLEETMYGDIWQKEDYLNWMYERLLAIKEVMSETASIFVHLDYHIGHYVKVLMDEVFGEENFVNDIAWHYTTSSGAVKKKFIKNHDYIFFYAKNKSKYVFNQVKVPWPKATLKKWQTDDDGRIYRVQHGYSKRYYIDPEGKIMDDVWNITLASRSHERIGYATQKPEALLDRIIKSGSNEGMVVADFFGGSGVTAKVAHDLGRQFVTADVGINAIQTIRDRLVEAGSNFDILKIRDGVDLFRNPQQTMDKLANIIPGVTTKHDYGKFWYGAIADEGMICPCWTPKLLDKSQAILNSALFSLILDETAKLDNVSKVVICSIDIIDAKALKKMEKERDLRDEDGKPIQFVHKDLKELVDLLVSPDHVEYSIKKDDGKYVITLDRLISDYLMKKIAEFNNKKKLGDKQVLISDEGLELIEFISLDCTSKDGAWHSDHEIKISNKGYMVVDGEKTKDRWDGTITVSKKPIRMKVRNIAGDEVVIKLEKNET